MPVKEKVGLVVSDKMDKTVVVAVENRAPHPKYRKIVVQTKRYKVHDEENQCKVGDRVRILETRPLSRTKRWTVAEILSHSFIAQPKAAAQPSVQRELEPPPQPVAQSEPAVEVEVAPSLSEPQSEPQSEPEPSSQSAEPVVESVEAPEVNTPDDEEGEA